MNLDLRKFIYIENLCDLWAIINDDRCIEGVFANQNFKHSNKVGVL